MVEIEGELILDGFIDLFTDEIDIESVIFYENFEDLGIEESNITIIELLSTITQRA